LYKRNYCNTVGKQTGAKPVTVCIAAICDAFGDYSQKIVLCADRLTSSWIQFESATSKIKKITEYCYAIQSSNNSLASDLILERLKKKVSAEKDKMKISDIMKALKRECIDYKKDTLEREVLFKYEFVSEKLKTDLNQVQTNAVNDVQYHRYSLDCNFILAGIEEPNEAHIYSVNQNGDYALYDSQGFHAIGSGSYLAFSEMTKHQYSGKDFMSTAIPRVYMAKKISERSQGVGRDTDFGVLFFAQSMENKKPVPAPAYFDLSTPQLEIFPILDKALKKIQNYEKKTIEDLKNKIDEKFARPEQKQ